MSDKRKYQLHEDGDSEKSKIFRNTESFSVPDKYFEKLPYQIQDKVNQNKNSGFRKLWIYLAKPQIAIASISLVLVLIISINYFNQPTKLIAVLNNKNLKTYWKAENERMIAETSIKQEDLNSNHIENIEEDIIVEEMEKDIVAKPKIEKVEDEKLAANTEEIEYLLENDIDVNLIFDEIEID